MSRPAITVRGQKKGKNHNYREKKDRGNERGLLRRWIENADAKRDGKAGKMPCGRLGKKEKGENHVDAGNPLKSENETATKTSRICEADRERAGKIVPQAQRGRGACFECTGNKGEKKWKEAACK